MKNKFLIEKEKLFSDKKLYDYPLTFCKKYSALVDNFIKTLLGSSSTNLVVAAVGGFARKELSPYSDVDLMFISTDSKNYENEIQYCITTLWDSGIEVSHTIREFSDIKKFLVSDYEAFTQFFETRFLTGNTDVFTAWNQNILKTLKEKNIKRILHYYSENTKLRHGKYGKTPKVLEPNIKNTCGGLRDMHVIEWSYSIVNKRFFPVDKEKTQTEIFINELLKQKLINNFTAVQLLNSYQILLKARNNLHLIEGKKNDKLEFTYQKKIAEKLGYSKYNWKEFMYNYFESATTVSRFSKTMMKTFVQSFSKESSIKSETNLDVDFKLTGDILFFNNNNKVLSISDIMKAFYFKCKTNAKFDKNLRSKIIESIGLIKANKLKESFPYEYFRKMLRLPNNVGNTLFVMNEFGLLEIIIPEFNALNGFFQPGNYHYYTGDEHTLIAIQNLENLYQKENRLASVFRSLKFKDVLYLSILFHDIAKPISVANHETIGAEIAKKTIYNLGYDESTNKLVEFLIKNHLEMAQVAFRRELNDPIVLNNFIVIFPSVEALDMLYLLTYADISAVNPRVWTQWKADLLYELYSNSKSMLIKKITGEELIGYKVNSVLNNDINRHELIKKHLDQVDGLNYIFHFSHNEIIQHIDEIINEAKISVLFKKENSFTNVTVITEDSSFLLTKLCAVFVINDLNIHDARIFTRKDGIVIDSFNVTDFITGKSVNEHKYERIKIGIENVLSGKLNIAKEIQNVQQKWKRRINKYHYSKTKPEIEFEEHDNYNIIDISVPDKIGLLYKITDKMSKLNLIVTFAKISTKVDGVVDTFYVTKNDGKKIKPSEYQIIRNEIMNEIKDFIQ